MDMEICIDQIANMRVEQMNLVMEATRQAVLSKYAPGEDDLYMRTLELGQVQESDYYSHVIHDDLDSIVRDIREAHRKDKTTADPQPTLDDVKEKFEQAIHQGSDIEMLIHEFCDKLQIPFEKISSEDFSAFLRILSLSKHTQKSQQYEGKDQPHPAQPQGQAQAEVSLPVSALCVSLSVFSSLAEETPVPESLADAVRYVL